MTNEVIGGTCAVIFIHQIYSYSKIPFLSARSKVRNGEPRSDGAHRKSSSLFLYWLTLVSLGRSLAMTKVFPKPRSCGAEEFRIHAWAGVTGV